MKNDDQYETEMWKTANMSNTAVPQAYNVSMEKF